MIQVAPSILAADPMRMGEEIRKMVAAGCDWLHVDVMDGHFVPNISYGPALAAAVGRMTDTPMDVHLMISEPCKYIKAFADAGARLITVHAEAEDPGRALRMIRERGLLAGLALKPATAPESVTDLLGSCDLALVMTVEPGFGGQSFMADMVPKLGRLRELGFTGLLEADGGVSLNNLGSLAEAGLQIAVMGTALYKSSDPAAMIAAAHATGARHA